MRQAFQLSLGVKGPHQRHPVPVAETNNQHLRMLRLAIWLISLLIYTCIYIRT